MSTSDRAARVTEPAPPPTSHAANCVCASCLALRPLSTLAHQMRSDSIVRLDSYQRRLLHTFTIRWNADRHARGLPQKTTIDALTGGLEALIAMLGQEI